MKSAIFKVLFLSLCIIANTHFAYSQTASILPQGKTQFLDNNGKPLTSGTVDFYIPATTTRKTTWQNSGESIANTNPVVLDAGGRAIIYGDGNYRMVVKDRVGNLIYDQLTSSTGSSSTGPTATGDGDLVGTIKPWAGMAAPNQYVFSYGQEVSRTTYSALYTAITSTQPVFCNSGSPTLNGLSDTTNFWIGMSLEVSCVAAGFSTVVSKTAGSITMAANANVTTNVNAIFYPWGRGNGTTTFNLPDLRGVVLAGNNIMGGVSSSRLNTTYFGSTDPNSSGAFGGNQSNTITSANVPTLASSNFNTSSFTSTTSNFVSTSNTFAALNNGGGAPVGGFTDSVSQSKGAVTSTAAINSINTFSNSGGIAIGSIVAAGGSGYTNGAQVLTVLGGTCTTQPQVNVTVAGNIVTTTVSIATAGNCTIPPTNPVSTSGGGGTGATLNVSYSAQPMSRVQPTITTNYIIKVTPDANSATASGVTSLGGMTGSIGCGNLSCTGNIITLTGSSPVNVSAGVVSLLSWYNNRVVNVESCGAVGDGVTDDAPAIRTCASQVAANTYGGTVQFSCNATYLLGSLDPASTLVAILHPYSNVTYRGCGDSSILKIKNGLNTVSVAYLIFYPSDATATYSYNNIAFRDFRIDNNGANNSGFNYSNVNIGCNYCTNVLIDNVSFTNSPGSQYIQIGRDGGINAADVRISNNRFTDACDVINASCTDHSSIFIIADTYAITGNNFKFSSQSTKATALEMHGTSGSASGNSITFYSKTLNVVAQVSHTGRALSFVGNSSSFVNYGLQCYATNSQVLQDILVSNNTFLRSTEPVGSGIGFIDCGLSTAITNANSSNIKIVDNVISSIAAVGTAMTEPVIVTGRIQGIEVSRNQILTSNGPCIGNNANTLDTTTRFTIRDNICIDTGATSTPASRRGILFSSGTTINSMNVSGNRIENVASTYMTTGIDVTINTTYGYLANDNFISNIATAVSLSGTGWTSCASNGVPYSSGVGSPYGCATALTGAIINTDPSTSVPSLTRNPVLGVAGSAVGDIGFRNGTSGSVTLRPVTGALGSAVISIPAATDTMAVLALAQAFTNKTYNGLTLTSTTGTFTLTNAKTLSVSNTLTFSGTDGSTLNIGTGGTLGTAAFQNTGTSGANIPFLNGANTFSGASVFSNTLEFDGATTWKTAANTGVVLQNAGGGVNMATLTWNGTVGGAIQVNDSAGGQQIQLIGNQGSTFKPLLTFGSTTAATGTVGETAWTKITASGSAPGAGFCKIFAEAGTTGGTCRLSAYCGTSTTKATILDNIGGGC